MNATATLQTTNAKRYLGQFCKHFAHKLPVEHAETNETGTVTFGTGTCTLTATETTLNLTITATTADQTKSLQDVVDRHLTRFAFREPVTLAWVAAG
jgi:hypothetical protein